MRPTLRAAGLFALVVVAITCADAPTGPSRGGGSDRTAARLGFAPSFSAEAARAYRSLVEFGFDVTNVRVRLTAADGRVAKDTVFSFPATQDTLQMDFSVQMQGSEQTFTALLELRDANNVVLFSGTRLVTARAGVVPGASQPAISLEYSGPGRDARALSVSPSDVTIAATGTTALAATALDAAGGVVSELLVRWTSSDSTLATLSATGGASAEIRGTGKRGVATITALTPTGLAASAKITLVPAASRLVVISGSAQTGVAGGALSQPLVVELQAADGGPVPSGSVAFRSVSAGGGVATTTATTDASGRASTVMTLGKTAGAYTFEASSGALAPATVTATATPAPASSLVVVSGDAQTDSIGRALGKPLVVKVTDEFGEGVAGAPVEWSVLAGGGTLGAASTISDANGLASVSYTLGRLARTDSVRARLATASGSGAGVMFTARGGRRTEVDPIPLRNGTEGNGGLDASESVGRRRDRRVRQSRGGCRDRLERGRTGRDVRARLIHHRRRRTRADHRDAADDAGRRERHGDHRLPQHDDIALRRDRRRQHLPARAGAAVGDQHRSPTRDEPARATRRCIR